ncbi:MAG: hypothetical protein A3J74_07930 [Elusimicrobia bacterium RIFCSPHIGHO2_02_FULL_57_9]|nr:MAG: hypothetical protein A3J74_07930 [Elusimicrobia bacterium RIFCSPHIGHO2_02_FULL_57_9]
MFQRTGCGGFPVSQAKYFQTFKAVEIGATFQSLPRLATAENWRRRAPHGFEFSMRAWREITHPPAGHFRSGIKTELAWDQTRCVAESMKARFVVFETPASFYPDANHLRDMYRFFKSIRRNSLSLVWQPRGRWEQHLVNKVSCDLGLIQAVNPLEAVVIPDKTINYFRLPAPCGGAYNDAEMKEIHRRCGSLPSYVFFTSANAWRDARRFEALINQGSVPSVRNLRRL